MALLPHLHLRLCAGLNQMIRVLPARESSWVASLRVSRRRCAAIAAVLAELSLIPAANVAIS